MPDSTRLAIDSFAPWRDHLAALSLAGQSGFTTLTFARRGSNGLGGTPPVFAAWLEGPAGSVAVDAAPSDPAPQAGDTAAIYFSSLQDKRRSALLLDEMQRLAASGTYTQVDAIALIKKYVGLARGLRPATLLYLFPEAREHRRETEGFARAATLPNTRVVAMSYGELWSAWAQQPKPAWLAAHAAALRRQYESA